MENNLHSFVFWSNVQESHELFATSDMCSELTNSEWLPTKPLHNQPHGIHSQKGLAIKKYRITIEEVENE